MNDQGSRLNNSIQQFVKNPRKLFVLDGIGAIFSAVLLGIVLVKLNSVFGIPVSTLYLLASIPLVFVLYDAIALLVNLKFSSSLLKVIATANLLYCVLSLSLAFYHIQEITVLGWIYILLEIVILVAIIALEFSVAKRILN